MRAKIQSRNDDIECYKTPKKKLLLQRPPILFPPMLKKRSYKLSSKKKAVFDLRASKRADQSIDFKEIEALDKNERFTRSQARRQAVLDEATKQLLGKNSKMQDLHQPPE